MQTQRSAGSIARIFMLMVLGVAVACSAAAQSYPNRVIRMIVPFPPGGGSDYMARIIQSRLADNIGQNIVIDNRGGAGGTVGSDMAAKATPDGYTIVMGSVATHAISASLYKKLPYDPIKDFSAVAPVGSMPHILVVHPTLNVKTAQELIALAKAKPGAVNYASAGSGSVGHLTVELFKSMAGIDLRHIPYKGSGPALVDLAGGQVKVMFDTLATGLPHVKSGRLRGLAVSSVQRAPAAPEVPPLAEVGVPGFEVRGWYGILAPAGTPASAVQALNSAIVKIMRLPEVRDLMISQGAEPMTASAGEFATYLKKEVLKWGEVVKKSGARVD